MIHFRFLDEGIGFHLHLHLLKVDGTGLVAKDHPGSLIEDTLDFLLVNEEVALPVGDIDAHLLNLPGGLSLASKSDGHKDQDESNYYSQYVAYLKLQLSQNLKNGS